MADTVDLDNNEKLNVMFKNFLGFPFTNEDLNYYDETTIQANNYINGENIFLDNIPINPSGWIDISASDVNIDESKLAIHGYIKEDSTRVIRKYNRLILKNISIK